MDHEIPLPEDFLSWRELNPDKPCPETVSECQACGISIFRSLEDVKRAPKRVPAFKRMKVAEGNLNKNLGNLKNTPSNKTGKSHCTWWIPQNSEPWKVFQIMDISN